MRSTKKTDYRQTNLTFLKQDLWEKFPPSHQAQCCELIVQMLRAVLMPTQPEKSHERED